MGKPHALEAHLGVPTPLQARLATEPLVFNMKGKMREIPAGQIATKNASDGLVSEKTAGNTIVRF